jgi:hypothetical protein
VPERTTTICGGAIGPGAGAGEEAEFARLRLSCGDGGALWLTIVFGKARNGL